MIHMCWRTIVLRVFKLYSFKELKKVIFKIRGTIKNNIHYSPSFILLTEHKTLIIPTINLLQKHLNLVKSASINFLAKVFRYPFYS